MASPFCSFYASYVQQKITNLKAPNLIEDQNIVKELKQNESTIAYPTQNDSIQYPASVLVFADASKSEAHGHVGDLTGLLIGGLKENAMYHCILWQSHKSERTLKSLPAAEILAAGEGIGETKIVSHVYSEILNMAFNTRLFVDSKTPDRLSLYSKTLMKS